MLRNSVTTVLRDLAKFRSKQNEFFKASCIALQQKNHYGTVGDLIQNIRFNYFFDARHHLDNDKWAKLFCVEGNVGVGKAAFAKEFAEKLDLRHFPTATTDYFVLRMKGFFPDEKIEWEMSEDSAYQKMLSLNMDKFCEEPTNWVHTSRLQLWLLQMRHFQYCDALAHLLRTGQGAVLNRHFYSDLVHAEAQQKMGWIRKDVWKYYQTMTFSSDEFLLPPQVVIYLDVPAEQCYENIQAGNNEAEKRLSLEYLKRVEDAYKAVYFPKARERGVNIIEVDGTSNTSVDEVIGDLDNLPTMLNSFNLWNVGNYKLKRLMIRCEDLQRRIRKFKIYSPIEELWNNESIKEAMEMEIEMAPFRYPKGLNAELGDRNIFWKYL
ncbi:NADH dehydrogenase [ubiquinone] 1 alpha subcomplex subunit 10, mitochondrial-like [Clavelina lepadiformis]|uniref:NADH dehydrogenase [ubiquinone] 1 alpha subcomplex subunit 10, mitochondrial-like n=1 Tax=Clavelina lepadiformis TaxID=159417 RepID=UPI004041B34F